MGGLFLKLVDVAVLAHVHDTEAGGFLEGDLKHGDGAGGVLLKMLAEHVGVVHLVDMVAGEDDNVFGVIGLDKAYVLIDSIGGA